MPAPAVKSVEEILEGVPQPADTSIARSGETLRQSVTAAREAEREWRDKANRLEELFMRLVDSKDAPGQGGGS